MNFNNFCKDEFWNSNTTWNTETPKLTKCLSNGFTIIPSLIFFFLIIFEFTFIFNSKNKRISNNGYNVTRILICLLGIYSSLELFKQNIYAIQNDASISDLISSICQFLVYIFLILIYHYQRIRGVITSGIIFISTLLFTLSSFVILLDTLLYNQSMYNEIEKNNISRIFLSNICLFFLACLTDDPVDAGLRQSYNDENLSNNNNQKIETEVHKKAEISPKRYSPFISKVFFFWYSDLIKKSSNREIRLDEVYEVEDFMKVDYVTKKFNKEFVKELEFIKKQNQNSTSKKFKYNSVNSLKVIFRVEGLNIAFFGFLKTIADLLTFFKPVLMSYMIDFIKDKEEPKWHGLIILIGFIVSSTLRTLFFNIQSVKAFAVAINLRTSFSNLIFNKTFRLSPSARNKRTTGEIVNLFAIDSNRFCQIAMSFCYIWSTPLQLVIGFYIIYNLVGNAIFFSLFMMILIMTSQYFLNRFLHKFLRAEMKINDERIKLLNEVLAGIKVIKLYAYEKAFIDRITEERNKQIKYARRSYYIEMVINWIFFSVSPFLMLSSTFAIYIFFVGADFTPEKAFVVILIFNILDSPIESLPNLLCNMITLKISLRRMSSFLAENEIDDYVSKQYDDELALSIKNKARFVWQTEKDQEEYRNNSNGDQSCKNGFKMTKNKSDLLNKEKKSFELKNIELEVKKGQFIAIIGQVGSGKSSLISAILGEMHLVQNDFGAKGKVNICNDHDISYVAQQAWIQNETFKGNILFGKPFNKEKYEDVIRACALEADLMQFEGGDLTEIGEKGINLSGGQKQRVSLARACYSSILTSNKQIILLDDVLSAVDAHVGKHLCENVLNSKTGILKDTTRILVTNQLNQLVDLDVDQIVLLKDGKIELKCTFDELMELEKNGKLDKFNLRLTQNQKDDEDKNSNKSSSQKSDGSTNDDEDEKQKFKSINNQGLIEKERREKGRVDYSNHLIYLKNYGYLNAALVLIFLITENFFQIYSRVYLAKWTGSKQNTTDVDEIKNFHKDHLLIFVGISSLGCLFDILMNFFMIFGILSTIKLFHEQLLYRILRSKMNFFDKTPLGRIINRFSKDIEAIDDGLPFSLRELTVNLLKLIASISIIVIKQPDSLIFYCIIFAIYYYVMNLYIDSSRQLRRFDSTTRSPIYSHLSETISGLETLRAYNKNDEFIKSLKSKINTNNRTYWYFLCGNRWLNIILDLLTSLILLVVSVQFIVQKDSTAASEAGLLLSYALNLSSNLASVVRLTGRFETNAVSIERVNEYCNNEEEDKWIKDVRPEANWPSKGEIEFINYSTKYRADTNLVLKNLNFKVNETEKVGIVGRTGSGKSTSTLALFRILEAVEGRILIDNVDISQIGLHDLRSRISIIPQDAVLFTGTIRFNLDPFNKYSDHEIYKSLEHAHLKNYVKTLENGIYHKIAEGGQNISSGQRQLICLARALLRKSKILVLDEATASIDFVTDELVQQTIRSEFKDCTTITIAHRLNTVLDSSRILLLDKGELKEFDDPDNLLKNTNSMFHKLALKANVI